MTMTNKEILLQWVSLLAESFNRRVSTLLLETYWRSLKSYPWEKVEQAMLSCLQNPERTFQGMPTPAELIRFLQGDQSQRARRAWTQVVATRCNRSGVMQVWCLMIQSSMR